MKYTFIILFSAIVLAISSGTAFAYEVNVAPDISISENYVSDNNLYLASLRTWFNTTHQKDIVSASFDQTINGTIFGDVTLVGKKIYIKGETFDDVRIIADTVTISGVVNKDLVIVARNINILPEAIVNGDALFLANNLSIQGQFLGQSKITASKITVAGSIVGPTTITGTKIIISESAKIQSDISYFSPQRAVIAPGAELKGQLNFNQIESIKQNDVIKRLFFGFVSFWAIIKLIATLFVIFVLTHLFKVYLQRIIENVHEKKLSIFLTGIFSIIFVPILIIILFASLVLIPVSVIVGSLFMISIMLLPAMSAIISASFYQKYIQKQSKILIDFNISALMLILLTFVGFLPYIGGIIIYLLYILSFGAMTRYLYDQIRRKKINYK